MSTINYDEMPVFAPNEYFWANHWDGKEEKWKAYARAVRKIIAEQGGFELFDVDMEDKLTYKSMLRGRPSGKNVPRANITNKDSNAQPQKSGEQNQTS